MSRLTERKSTSAQLEEALLTTRSKLVRVNVMLRESDVSWLRKTVDAVDHRGGRITTRSDIIRVALRELQNKDEENLLELLA